MSKNWSVPNLAALLLTVPSSKGLLRNVAASISAG